jgi:hypothetical protein
MVRTIRPVSRGRFGNTARRVALAALYLPTSRTTNLPASGAAVNVMSPPSRFGGTELEVDYGASALGFDSMPGLPADRSASRGEGVSFFTYWSLPLPQAIF